MDSEKPSRLFNNTLYYRFIRLFEDPNDPYVYIFKKPFVKIRGEPSVQISYKKCSEVKSNDNLICWWITKYIYINQQNIDIYNKWQINNCNCYDPYVIQSPNQTHIGEQYILRGKEDYIYWLKCSQADKYYIKYFDFSHPYYQQIIDNNRKIYDEWYNNLNNEPELNTTSQAVDADLL